MGRKRVHKSAGDARQRKRAVKREKRARRAEHPAQTAETIVSFYRLGACTGTQRVTVFTGKKTDLAKVGAPTPDYDRPESLKLNSDSRKLFL